MLLVHVIQEQLRNLDGSVWVMNWNEMSILREFVNDHQDRIEAIRCRQTLHEVHTDNFLGLRRYWEWFKETRQFSVLNFSLLTNGALLHKGLH
jgi:hypothetical protein